MDRDYIERMNDEYAMLCNRIEKLKNFYGSRYRRRLNDFTCYLLKKQLREMKAYRKTLKLRIRYEESRMKEYKANN